MIKREAFQPIRSKNENKVERKSIRGCAIRNNRQKERREKEKETEGERVRVEKEREFHKRYDIHVKELKTRP